MNKKKKLVSKKHRKNKQRLKDLNKAKIIESAAKKPAAKKPAAKKPAAKKPAAKKPAAKK